MTEFYLNTVPQHYKACYDFVRKVDPAWHSKLTMPTVRAVRDNKVVGVIGRNDNKKAVIAGCLAIEPDPRKGILAVKLVEIWEGILLNLGCTSYLIPVDKDNQKLSNAFERLGGLKPYTEDEKYLWYQRSITNA